MLGKSDSAMPFPSGLVLWLQNTYDKSTQVNLHSQSPELALWSQEIKSTKQEEAPAEHDQTDTSQAEDIFDSRVLKAVIEMGNSVLAKKAAMELNRLKARHRERFQEASLFQKTLAVLERNHYRLWQRQFILDLFDKGIIRRIVLEEDLEDEMDTGTE